MRLLQTVQLDASDSFMFERAAEPAEWAVSGAFAFLSQNVPALQGRARAGFRAGFLGLGSLGRSTLVQIVEAQKHDHAAVVELLASQLVARFGAPDIVTAHAAAMEEVTFTASLCQHPAGVIVAVTRTFDDGSIREKFRMLRPAAQSPSRAFNFVETSGEDDAPEEHLDLTMLRKGIHV